MTSLKPSWLDATSVSRLLAAFEAAGIEARFVGGCVRDALLGLEIGDIDLATPARPEAVIAALKKAKIKAIPTGIAHGTVTAVVKSHGVPRTFEITTLRRDVETDGRRAKVAFDADWAEDAARRDFTINAIYLAPDGTIFDPVGGQADLAAHRVRFVGDPAKRIAEDVLRILRYYRFEARVGENRGNVAARAACKQAASRLVTLSAERVWSELKRILALPNPVRPFRLMRNDRVLSTILPEATRFDRLQRLIRITTSPSNVIRDQWEINRKISGHVATDPWLRFEALINVTPNTATSLGARLHLSRAEQKRLAEFASLWTDTRSSKTINSFRTKLFLFGGEHSRDVALITAADKTLPRARWKRLLELASEHPPDFPLKGYDVTNLGIPSGPRVGQLLKEIKDWWANNNYVPGRAACLAHLKELAARP
jgi:poly(A) polymerase